MIERVIRLKNVGLLRQPLPSCAVDFGRSTLLYGENGRGKSTFAAVCRSLATNDASILLSRCTLGSVDDPDVLLRVDGANYEFSSSSWTGQCESLVVFDADFVDRNVHSGARVEAEHRESLLEFALGETGVAIKRRIDAITGEVGAINRDVQALRRGVTPAAAPYSVDEYLGLSPEAGIDDEVARLEQEMSRATNAAAIARRPSLTPISLPTLDLGPIGEILGESVASLSGSTWREVEDHVQRLGAGGEQWVREGLGRVDDNRCPFCAQDLDGSPLFESYGTLFGAAYQALHARVIRSQQGIEIMLSDAALDAIREAVSSNWNAPGLTEAPFLGFS